MADMALCFPFVNGRIESLPTQSHWLKHGGICKPNGKMNFWRTASSGLQNFWEM